MFKNNKGFTLIELLAVIVILALIVVIATMSVNKTIVRTRTTSFENSMDVAVKTAKRILADEDLTLDNDTLKSNIEYSTSDYDYELESSGSGYILKIISNENGKFKNIDFGTIDKNENYTYVKNDNGKNMIVVKIDEEADFVKLDDDTIAKIDGTFPETCNYFERKKTYNVGDKISFCNLKTGDSENFYVTKDNGDSVTAFAEYDIVEIDNDVKQAESNFRIIFAEQYKNNKVKTGTAYNYEYLGYWTNATNYKLDKPLATYGTEYPANVYDKNSKLYSYVSKYVEYVKNKFNRNIEARLITLKELEELGCVSGSCADNLEANGRTWLISSSYWTATAFDHKNIETVNGGIGLSRRVFYEFSYGTPGIRPIVTITKSEL